MATTLKIDFESIARSVGEETLVALKNYVIGESDDLARWAREIAGDAVRAARAGREDILAELREQSKMVAELYRIKTQDMLWDQVARVLTALAKVAIQAVQAVKVG